MIPTNTPLPRDSTDLPAPDFDMNFSCVEPSHVGSHSGPSHVFGDTLYTSSALYNSHLSYPHLCGEWYDPQAAGNLDLSLIDNFLSNAEQQLSVPSAYDYNVSGVAYNMPPIASLHAPPPETTLLPSAIPNVTNVAADPISHRPSAQEHSQSSSSSYPYASPQPQQVAHAAALRSLATMDVHGSEVVPTRAVRSDRPSAAFTVPSELVEAIRMPRMKVRVASPRTIGTTSASRYSPYPQASPKSSSDFSSASPSSAASPSPSSDSPSDTNSPSTSTAPSTMPASTKTCLRYTCHLPACPSPHKTYGRPADLERHILTAGTHLLPSDAWLCCGIPLAEVLRRRDIPQAVLTQTPREYHGLLMVGGCGQHNSRKDSLKRHLERHKGVCWTDKDGWWLVGNRARDERRRELDAMAELSLGLASEGR